jgi:hypothetical protein
MLCLIHSSDAVLIFASLSMDDLTPNVGLYWYFCTEMFDVFRSFFVAVIQLHLISLVLPVTVKLRCGYLILRFLDTIPDAFLMISRLI